VPTLGSKPTLLDLQSYVKELEAERGFADQVLIEKCLLLGEEVGELFKSVRKCTNMSIEDRDSVSDAADEIADILIMLISVANRLDVDIEEAFRRKEEVNKKRTWTKES